MAIWWAGLAALLVAAIIATVRFRLRGTVSMWFGLVVFFKCSSAGYAIPTAYYKDGGNGQIGPDNIIWMAHAAIWTFAVAAFAGVYCWAKKLRRHQA